MDPFEAGRNVTARTQATGILALLLNRLVGHGFLTGETTSLANQMVTLAWAKKPDLFEGDSGPSHTK